MRLAAPTALLLVLAGCAAEEPAVGIQALSIDDRSDTEGYVPSTPGEIFVGLRVRLLNATEAPLPVDEARFELAPATWPATRGDPLTRWLDDGCAGELPAGEPVECVVGFALRDDFEPTRIVYEADGVRAEADVALSRPPPGDGLRPTNELDLLVMSDDSGSLVEEQASFTAELPRLMEILGSGDLDGDGGADFEPFDIHAAVVTSDMGVGGFTVPTCAEARFGDDGILKTEGRDDLAGCEREYPTFLTFAPDADAEAFARDVACLTFDTGGCGFEQPLEAVLKALSPSEPTRWTAPGFVPPIFAEGTAGHGDGANAGFVRPDSVLAVVMLSDEDDCSARDTEIFDASSRAYRGTDLNLRCFAHADRALHPLPRYIDGLRQLRRDPRRLVIAPIVGFPVEYEPPPGERPDWGGLISEDPAVRDDRMEERVDPSMPSRLQPSCSAPDRGIAMPPVRILRVASQLEVLDARVAIGSICQERYANAFDGLIAHIVAAGRGER